MNSRRFEVLHAQRETVELAYGAPLEWDSMDGRKATRICEYLPSATIEDEDSWDQYLDWMLDKQTRLRRAIAAGGGVGS